jgi:hypothetical protein
MLKMNPIVDKMQVLQQIFKDAKSYAEQEQDLEEIAKHLQSFAGEFISIAFEATAMALALKDFGQWTFFLNNYGQKHAVQVHVGLGWALAQGRKDGSALVAGLAPLLGPRVWDGYGYYDGFFRRRKALQSIMPEGLNKKAVAVYTQGLGRSFWYTSKGAIDKLLLLVEQLPNERHRDLWRGIGIASTYVGGGTAEQWEQLWNTAGTYQAQLATGAALAIKSRISADSLLDDEMLSSSLWCQMGVRELVQFLEKNEPSKEISTDDIYHNWIILIDDYFNK